MNGRNDEPTGMAIEGNCCYGCGTHTFRIMDFGKCLMVLHESELLPLAWSLIQARCHAWFCQR
jgi:hypothetical protein